MENQKFYLTRAKYDTLLKEIQYLEKGEGSELLAKLLASSPGSGMGRPNDLPAHVLAGEIMGYLKETKTIISHSILIDEYRTYEEDHNMVIIGSTVSVHFEMDPETIEYTILGQKEVNISLNRISYLSPIGSAIIGKMKGDYVLFTPPESNRQINIKIDNVERKPLDFQYSESDWKDKLERALLM